MEFDHFSPNSDPSIIFYNCNLMYGFGQNSIFIIVAVHIRVIKNSKCLLSVYCFPVLLLSVLQNCALYRPSLQVEETGCGTMRAESEFKLQHRSLEPAPYPRSCPTVCALHLPSLWWDEERRGLCDALCPCFPD